MGPSGPNPEAHWTKYEMRGTERSGEPPRQAPSPPRAQESAASPPARGAKRQLMLAYLADDDSGAAGSAGVAGAGITGSGASGGPQL